MVLLDIDLGGESGFEIARRLQREGDRSTARLSLISTHEEEDYAELIEASPVVGFLPKERLSADAIRDLLDRESGGGSADRVSEPRGT